MRDYNWAIENGYSAQEYAEIWGWDLYDQLYDSAIESVWENHPDLHEKYSNKLDLSEDLSDRYQNMLIDAYKESYLRYQKELSNPDNKNEIKYFEEWEVDGAAD